MSDVTIRTRENGPLVIEGPIKVVDAAGNAFPIPEGKTVIALCRCGASSRKPFCDGKHRDLGFVASECAPVPTSPDEA